MLTSGHYEKYGAIAFSLTTRVKFCSNHEILPYEIYNARQWSYKDLLTLYRIWHQHRYEQSGELQGLCPCAWLPHKTTPIFTPALQINWTMNLKKLLIWFFMFLVPWFWGLAHRAPSGSWATRKIYWEWWALEASRTSHSQCRKEKNLNYVVKQGSSLLWA